MLYVLFILIFLMFLAISVVLKKQNTYFQQQGLKVTGRVIAIEEQTVKPNKLSAGTTQRLVPIIEYAHKSKTWHFQSDEDNRVSQRRVGDIVELVVHAEHPLVMTQKDLDERSMLSLIFMGLLLVPLGMCFAVYEFSKHTSQLMLFEPLGITAQHLQDIVAVIVIIQLLSKVFWPMWQRWKRERDVSFLGLPFNTKVVQKHRAVESKRQDESSLA